MLSISVKASKITSMSSFTDKMIKYTPPKCQGSLENFKFYYSEMNPNMYSISELTVNSNMYSYVYYII